jgi:hypothetical protein
MGPVPSAAGLAGAAAGAPPALWAWACAANVIINVALSAAKPPAARDMRDETAVVWCMVELSSWNAKNGENAKGVWAMGMAWA